jgi:hypothetical protein
MKTNYKSDFAKLLNQVETLDQKQERKNDDRYWKLGKDKTGNGVAEIRFLPELPGEVPVVKLFNHYYQDKTTKKWFIGNCPTTINLQCPVCEHNIELWDTGEVGQDIAKGRKRKLSYIANILVINDPINPENTGKVFLFKFGQKIYDKLKAKIKPMYDFEEKINPFDLEEGANFILKGTIVKLGDKESLSYDQSAFSPATNLTKVKGLDIDALMDSRHSVIAEVATDKFDSYEDLKTRFNKASTGTAAPKKNVEGQAVNSKNETAEETSKVTKEESAIKNEPKKEKTPLAAMEEDSEDEDYFKKLAEM